MHIQNTVSNPIKRDSISYYAFQLLLNVGITEACQSEHGTGAQSGDAKN